MIKVGIVGCGSISKMHTGILTELKEVELIAFADPKTERAAQLKQEYGLTNAAIYSSLEDMLTEESLDAVHICTPHYLHAPMAEKCLELGIHVMMEKPPAISRNQFAALKNTASSSKSRLGICFQNRYNESAKAVKKWLEDPTAGRILGARAFVTWFRDTAYYKESGWRGTLATEGGGVLINQAIHTLDLLVQFLGKPLQAEASVSNHHLKGQIEVEDTLEAYIQFQDGPACFYATTAHCCNAPILLEIVREHGTIRLEEFEVTLIHPDGSKINLLKTERESTVGKDYWGTGHKACIKDFYHSVIHEIPYQNDLASVENTFYLMMDIYDSARM